MKVQKVVSVKFRENVNFPGINDHSRATITDIWPFRSSVGTGDQFEMSFADGWLIVRNVKHGTRLRYPATMTREVMFEEDMKPEQKP
jgi:hypothetical protein